MSSDVRRLLWEIEVMAAEFQRLTDEFERDLAIKIMDSMAESQCS